MKKEELKYILNEKSWAGIKFKYLLLSMIVYGLLTLTQVILLIAVIVKRFL